MNLPWLEWLGNENPQLIREIKGRLTPRNIAIATAGSLLGQFLLMMWLSGRVSSYTIYPPYRGTPSYSYEPVKCIKDAIGNCAINWSGWWLEVFRYSSWILPLVLVIGGVYTIVSDLAREERRGTLNFIRLSPQSSQSILTGKVLGVPCLIYLGIALTLPLHLYAAQKAGIALGFVASGLAFLAVFCCFLYCGAVLYALMGGLQAWLGSALAFLIMSPFFSTINFFIDLEVDDLYTWRQMGDMGMEGWRWFYLRLGSPLAIAYSFTLLTLGLVTYGIWQLANRRFRNPNVTLIGKRQSYIAVACIQVWLLGFCLPALTAKPSEDYYFVTGCCFLFGLNPILLLSLIAALSPQRQTLQDWARYIEGKRQLGESRRQSFSAWSYAVQDLIWGEKSPAPVAIAINMLIVAASWVPWILLLPDNPNWISPPDYEADYKIKLLQGLLLTFNLIAISAVVVQLMLLMKTQKRSIWAASVVGAIFGLPLCILGLLSISPEKNPLLWILSAAPVFGVVYASTTTIFLTILGQWSVFAAFCLKLSRQLRQAGESTSKALLVGSK